MGTITINLEDETEKKFRKLAGSKYGKRKGALGEAFEEALQIWLKSESSSVKKAIELLEKGDYQSLPSDVYVRGFLKNLAQEFNSCAKLLFTQSEFVRRTRHPA